MTNKTGRKDSEHDLRYIALHQVGHALMRFFRFGKATAVCIPPKDLAGITENIAALSDSTDRGKRWQDAVLIRLAGPAMEWSFGSQDMSERCIGDVAAAKRILSQFKSDEMVDTELKNFSDQTFELFGKHLDFVERIALELVDKKKLSAQELRRLIQNYMRSNKIRRWQDL